MKSHKAISGQLWADGMCSSFSGLLQGCPREGGAGSAPAVFSDHWSFCLEQMVCVLQGLGSLSPIAGWSITQPKDCMWPSRPLLVTVATFDYTLHSPHTAFSKPGEEMLAFGKEAWGLWPDSRVLLPPSQSPVSIFPAVGGALGPFQRFVLPFQSPAPHLAVFGKASRRLGCVKFWPYSPTQQGSVQPPGSVSKYSCGPLGMKSWTVRPVL